MFAIFFGVLYSLLTPPFQVADEIGHFYRAYQISEGDFIAIKSNNRLGGYIPESLVLFANQYKKFIRNPNCKLRFDYFRQSKGIALQPEKIIYADFPNSALYSPVSYAPQSIAIFFLRIFDCKPFYLLYISRLANLIFWIIIIFISIRIIPIQKYLFVFLALLPMSISTASSLSADVVTNGLSFFLIAYILKTAFSNDSFSKRDFIIISIVVLSLGLAKLIYVFLFLLFFIIPISKFSSIRAYILVFISLAVFGFGSAAIWGKNIEKLYLPYKYYNIEYKHLIMLNSNADMTRQIDFIKNSNKLHLVKIFLDSYSNEFNGMIDSYVGELGWGDTELPNWLIIFSYIIIFTLALGTNETIVRFRVLSRALFIIISFVITGLIMLSQYLSYNSVGSNIISPLQGRYFIPVFPLIFIIFYNTRRTISVENFKNIFILLLFLTGMSAFLILYNRFYYNYDIEKKWEIISDPDQLNNNKEICIVDKGDTIVKRDRLIPSSEMAHSGIYSVKLTSQNQFGFTHLIYKVKKGDLVKISFWRYGDAGCAIISESANGGFFYYLLQRVKREHSGWAYFESEFFVPKDLLKKELRCYIWNNASDSAYFDQVKVSYYKKKKFK